MEKGLESCCMLGLPEDRVGVHLRDFCDSSVESCTTSCQMNQGGSACAMVVLKACIMHLQIIKAHGYRKAARWINDQKEDFSPAACWN